MKVFITGASGMVGRNLLAHPAIRGWDVLAPAREELDLSDYAAVEVYLMRHQPDIIVHCAGTVGGIQANMREPVRFLLDNLDMGRNVVLAAKTAGSRRLINLGSSCMYPRNAVNPLREETILTGELEPTNEGYALAKVVVARLCEYMGREHPEFRFKSLIPCNLYGPWDKFDPAHSHLIPAIIHKIHQAKARGEMEVEIWGDGTARREFMFAGDLADCLIQAIQRFDSLPAIMNVGLGHDYSIDEYYQATAAVLGYQGSFVHNLEKPVGMKRKVVDVSKMSTWGWRPGVPLQDGIEKTYQFYLEAN